MKKCLAYILIGLVAAGAGSAQTLASETTGDLCEKKPALSSAKEKSAGPQRKNNMMSEAQRSKIRADREKALRRMVTLIQNEMDPAKKAILVDQLRAKLVQDAERAQAGFRKRLELAEKEVLKMKKRLWDAEKNLDRNVEEQLKRVLSGERFERPQGKHSSTSNFHESRPGGPVGGNPDSPVQ